MHAAASSSTSDRRRSACSVGGGSGRSRAPPSCDRGCDEDDRARRVRADADETRRRRRAVEKRQLRSPLRLKDKQEAMRAAACAVRWRSMIWKQFLLATLASRRWRDLLWKAWPGPVRYRCAPPLGAGGAPPPPSSLITPTSNPAESRADRSTATTPDPGPSTR